MDCSFLSQEGRVALITGGSRGIGRSIALAFAEAGADVAVAYRRDSAAAEDTLRQLEGRGRRAAAFPADVRDADAVWDEERFQVLVEALEYAGNLGVAVRLHTAPPWREGMTKDEYRAVLEAYYERVASLPNLHAVQLFNEPNRRRFTDYGPLPQGARYTSGAVSLPPNM